MNFLYFCNKKKKINIQFCDSAALLTSSQLYTLVFLHAVLCLNATLHG